ncbi:MAG: site-2 protease family protein [Actinomycetia bacterium]|nr:site-2 protease family protein [Actinomycetes bacterium]MCP4087708.1 site-2 protease family protein [Actinomycetes bacterium]
MRESFRLGRLAGIPVGLNWSLLLVAGLITWSLADVQLPRIDPGLADSRYWTVGTLTALLFFASILAHEMGHAVIARREGIPVHGIVLWILGGVASLGHEAREPRAELRIAAAGPAVSAALAAMFAGLVLVGRSLGTADIVVAGLVWLGVINGLLALFNLLPATPLDGGRILRAVLWRRWADRPRATIVAGRSGQVVGGLVITAGLWEISTGSMVGLWTGMVGWFIVSGARSEIDRIRSGEALSSVCVHHVMAADPPITERWLTVGAVLADLGGTLRHTVVPVRAADGAIVGALSLDRLVAQDPASWTDKRVDEVMLPLSAVPVLSAGARIDTVLDRFHPSDLAAALVCEADGRLVGTLDEDAVRRAFRLGRLHQVAPEG